MTNRLVSFVQRICEYALRLLFAMARIGFLVLGLGLLGPALMLRSIPEDPAYGGLTATIARSTLLTGVVFVGAGVLIVAARRLVPRIRPADVPARTGAPHRDDWMWVTGPLMLGLAGVAGVASAELLRLWQEILVILDRLDFLKEAERAGVFSGLVVVPALAALSLPILEATAALFLTVVPVLLFALFTTRSVFFRRAFLVAVICQVALAVTGLAGAQATSVILDLMNPRFVEVDAETLQVLDMLQRFARTLSEIAGDFAWVTAAHVLLLPWILFSPRMATAFPSEQDSA